MTNGQVTDHDKVAEFYDNTYYRDASSQAVARPSRHLYRLAERLDVARGEQVLDIACGVGDWLRVVAERGGEVSGIDISKEAIQVCRERLEKGRFEVGVAEQLPFEDSSFDLVTCLGSLEHFLDQPAALGEMFRVARPGARVVILVPNSGFLTHRLGLYQGTYQQAVKETLRSLEQWQQLFEAQGIEILQRWRDLHILNWHWISRRPWYVVPLRLLQAIMLPIWPLRWQYQIYHLCRVNKS